MSNIACHSKRWAGHALIIALGILLGGCSSSQPPASGSATDPTGGTDQPTDSVAKGCYAIRDADSSAYVAKADGQYTVTAQALDSAEAFTIRPAGLGEDLIYDRDGQWFAAAQGLMASNVTPQDSASDRAIWMFQTAEPAGRVIRSSLDGRTLHVTEAGELALSEDTSSIFLLEARQDCAAYPEAELGASGEPFKGRNADGTVTGIADAHTHISAYQRLGGRFIHGDSFHRFGVQHALRDCAENHGPDGSADFVGNFVRDGQPAGTHATAGWPDFPEWPAHGTYSHQQTYYMWVKRAWMAGLRLLVNHTSGDEQLCQINPIRDTNCDEMDQVRRQVAGMYALQDYIDAQNGGQGAGWFRIVTGPAEARRVIEDGKLAVLLGIEASKLFNCGEFLDSPECTQADIDAGIDEFFGLGIRSVFLAHWFDNAFGGAGLFDQSELTLNALNKPETGHYYRVEDCPEPDMGANLQSFATPIDADNPVADAINDALLLAVPAYPPGPHCNAKGLTDLGAYVVEQLAQRGMIIETDHLSAKMKSQVLDIVEALDYPVVSGHYHAGGISSPTQHRQILALGGIAAPIKPAADDYAALARELETLAAPDRYFGVPMSTDSGGIASLPGAPNNDEVTINYPFQSRDGQVSFERQVTGNRTFDYNNEGIAHYGLFAEWIHAVGEAPDGDYALDQLFRSAEAYLQMWERTGLN